MSSHLQNLPEFSVSMRLVEAAIRGIKASGGNKTIARRWGFSPQKSQKTDISPPQKKGVSQKKNKRGGFPPEKNSMKFHEIEVSR